MHLINKLSHLFRTNLFKILIFILLVIYIYNSSVDNSKVPLDKDIKLVLKDQESKSIGKLTKKELINILLKTKLTGDKLVRSLKESSRGNNGNTNEDDSTSNAKNERFIDKLLKKLENNANPIINTPISHDVIAFKIKKDSSAENNQQTRQEHKKEEFEDENSVSKSDQTLKNNRPGKYKLHKDHRLLTGNLRIKSDDKDLFVKIQKAPLKLKKLNSDYSSKSQVLTSLKSRKYSKTLSPTTKPKEKAPAVVQTLGEDKIKFIMQKLPGNFTSKEELVEFIAKMNRINSEPIFSYLNKKWNSGGGNGDYFKRIITTSKPAGSTECHNWTYNAADYTLVYKPLKFYQNEPCPLPKGETVKKVVMPNKDIVWKGCTRKTSECSESPFFDTKHNVRRNVPPCCRDHLLEMLRNLDSELISRNITYTLTDGVVIGWYRNQKLVPYDADLDMYIDGTFFKTRVWDEVFGNLTAKYEYQYKKVEDYKFKLQYSLNNTLSIDIWPYFNIKLRTQYGEIAPGEWLTFVYHSGTTAIRMDEYFPPKRTTIEGVPCNVPRDTINYLNKNYGPTPEHWLPEMTCKTKNVYNCAT